MSVSPHVYLPGDAVQPDGTVAAASGAAPSGAAGSLLAAAAGAAQEQLVVAPIVAVAPVVAAPSGVVLAASSSGGPPPKRSRTHRQVPSYTYMYCVFGLFPIVCMQKMRQEFRDTYFDERGHVCAIG